MECPKCGFENPDSFKFCGQCAHPFMEQVEASSFDSPTESERKHVTIMFSDLSGYTAMTEKLDPEDVKEIMNQIFSESHSDHQEI
jgi:adenylate cyclase